MLNITEMQSFLKRLYGQNKGYLCATSKDWATGKWTQKFFKYPDEPGKAVDFIHQEQKADRCVYFCAHLLKSKGSRTKENAHDRISALWADLDECNPEEITPKPTILWQSSAGRFQAAWVLKESISSPQVEALNERLTRHTEADPGGWALTKVLRVPGSTNFKYNPPQQGGLLWSNGPEYTPQEIERAVREQEEAAEISVLPENMPSYTEALTEFGPKIPKGAWELLNATPDAKDDWSAKLWKLEKLLLEAGILPEYVFVTAKESPWNKYEREGRPENQLWEEVCKAASEVGYQPEEELPWMTDTQLTNYKKRTSWLVKGIWVDRNVGWIAGVGKSFKSTLALEFALSVASGLPFLGQFEVIRPGPVLIIQEEDPTVRTATRWRAIKAAKGLYCDIYTPLDPDEQGSWIEETDRSLIANLLLQGPLNRLDNPALLPFPVYFLNCAGVSFKNEDMLKQIEKKIQEIQPVMVTLDPFNMLATGFDEFKAGEIGTVLNRIKKWRNDYEIAVPFVHHYIKSGKGDSYQKLYGSQALYSWSENNLFIDKPDRNEGLIVVERDIKDSIALPKFKLYVHDIDRELDCELRDTVSISGQKEEEAVSLYRRAVAAHVDLHPKQMTLPRRKLEERLKIKERAARSLQEELVNSGDAKKDSAGKVVLTEEARAQFLKDSTEVPEHYFSGEVGEEND